MKVLNEGLMEKMLESENLRQAWKGVKANRGAAGMDGIRIEEFIEHIGPHWKKVSAKVLEGRYKPAAVKRVYIPKGNGDKRPLGIPTVLDRMLQQAMLQARPLPGKPCNRSLRSISASTATGFARAGVLTMRSKRPKSTLHRERSGS